MSTASPPDSDKTDFFISYSHKDEAWAKAIASHLKYAGYSVFVAEWNISTDNNFVNEMQRAVKTSERVLLVLSPHFIDSVYTQPEWQQAFSRDPTDEQGLFVPVRVADCDLEGMFSPLAYIDFFSLCQQPPSHKDQQQARTELQKN